MAACDRVVCGGRGSGTAYDAGSAEWASWDGRGSEEAIRRWLRVHVTLRLLRTDEGCRSSPMRSGYRSLVRVGSEQDFGFEVELDSDELAPGEVGAGRLKFWAVDELPALSPGQRLESREGASIIGHGEVVDVG